MKYARVQKTHVLSSQPQINSSHFTSQPSKKPPQRDDKPPTLQDEENQAYYQYKVDAVWLERHEKQGTITPEEQEKLGVLRAKMDNIHTQRMAKFQKRPNILQRLIQSHSHVNSEHDKPIQVQGIVTNNQGVTQQPKSDIQRHKKPEVTQNQEQKTSQTIPANENNSKIPPVVSNTSESTSGLAAKPLIDAIGKETSDFWKDPKNKNKPITDFSDFVIAKANEKLPYPCKYKHKSSGQLGVFDSEKWLIYVNKTQFSENPEASKVGDLTKDEASEIIDTIYHEARHSEQFFRIAQMRAGQGKTTQEIETEMNIPSPVAEAAVKSPLKGDTKTNKEMLAEAEAWDTFSYGKYGEYATEINSLLLLLNQGKDELAGINDQEEESETDTNKTEDKSNTNTNQINQTEGESEKSIDVKMIKEFEVFALLAVRISNQMDNFFNKLLAEVENNQQLDKFDKEVLINLKNIKSTFSDFKAELDQQKGDSKNYDTDILSSLCGQVLFWVEAAYKETSVEKDAGAVGYDANTSFFRETLIK